MATSPLDPSKINLYGAEPADTQEYQDALKASVDALSQRYANPNWFNVAAGFLKPQLGGFAASLGSANEALGANLEKQRETQLPLAQMRAQLAASKIAMGQKSTAAREFSDWQASGKPMDQKTYARLTGLSPDSATATAAKAAYEGERAEQGILSQQQALRSNQYAQEISSINSRYALGNLTKAQASEALAAAKAAYGPTQPITSARPVGAPGTTDTVEAANPLSNTLTPTPSAAETGTPGGYAKESDLRKIADVKNVPFDAAKEISSTKAQLPNLSAEDRANALGYIAELEGSLAGRPITKPVKREVIPPVFGRSSGLTPEQITAAVKPQEELAELRYKGLQEVAADENYNPIARAVSSQLDLMKNNREAANRVSAVLSRGGPGNAFLAAINEGVGLSINGLSGNVRLPVETFIRANLKPEDQDLAMAMANNYATIALAKQRVGSVNPNSARNSELGLYAGATPTLHTTANASMRALAHFKQDLELTKAQYDYANSLLQNRNPEYSLSEDDPARYSSALNSTGFGKLSDTFKAKHAQIDEAFQRSLKAKP